MELVDQDRDISLMIQAGKATVESGEGERIMHQTTEEGRELTANMVAETQKRRGDAEDVFGSQPGRAATGVRIYTWRCLWRHKTSRWTISRPTSNSSTAAVVLTLTVNLSFAFFFSLSTSLL